MLLDVTRMRILLTMENLRSKVRLVFSLAHD